LLLNRKIGSKLLKARKRLTKHKSDFYISVVYLPIAKKKNLRDVNIAVRISQEGARRGNLMIRCYQLSPHL
jgi:hypothetical protein